MSSNPQPRSRVTLRHLAFTLALITLTGNLRLNAQTPPNPVPFLTQPLLPSSAAPGSASFTLTVNGTGFVSGATVNWNGSARTTTFVSNSKLVATIQSQDITLPGAAAITVLNPSPGGGLSNAAYFYITGTAPSLAFSTLTGQGPPGFGPAIAADFDGDGNLDLAISAADTDQICILLGNGDGTFKPEITYTLSDGLSAPIAADFNKDGKLDLAIASSSDDTVSILLGNGDGTFQTPLIFTVGHTDGTSTKPVALIAGDFDRDGNLDLAFALQLSGTVGILLGNGDGDFRNLVEFPANKAPTGIAAADLNQDGLLDLAVSGPGTISILAGIGDGTFQSPKQVTVASGLQSIAAAIENVIAADLNHDGKIDLVAVMDNGIGHAGVAILIGNGNGTFLANVNYALDSDVHDAAIADFDADGKLDIAFLHDSSRGLSILPGIGDGTFSNEIQFVTGIFPDGGPGFLAPGDFNKDGQIDLAASFLSNFNATNLAILLQGQFPALSYPANLNFGQAAIGIPFGITVNLLDTGLLNLSISNIQITGANAGNYSITDSTCGSTLAPAATCNFVVTLHTFRSRNIQRRAHNHRQRPRQPAHHSAHRSHCRRPCSTRSCPSTLSFPTQSIGTTSLAQRVTLNSVGTADLTISQITLTGINAADFAASNTCSSSLAVGTSCQVSLTFTPAAPGTRVAAMNIAYNGPGSPQTLFLTGNPFSGPGLVIAPPSVSFPSQILGISSSTQPVLLVSAGTAPVSMAGITLTGTNAADYSATNMCATNLDVNANCEIDLMFTPSTIGASTATLQIADNTPGSPHIIPLAGLGQAAPVPTGSVSPSSLTFVAQTVGTTSASQSVIVTNVGTVSLTVSGPSILGANPGDFLSVGTCNSVQLAVGATCQINLSFRPLLAGPRTANLSIATNSPAGPLIVSLSGTALPPPPPNVTILPSTITFPSQFVGTSGLPKNVTLTNTGAAAFSITSVVASPADFGQLNSCGNSLAAGASCSIGVFFDPTVSGARAGTLTITDAAAGSPQTVPLSGTGQDFSVSAAAPASATVKAGQTAVYMLTLAPDGGFDQPVTLTCTGAPANSTCAVSPNPAALNGSAATATVTVSTTAASLSLRTRPKPTAPWNIGRLRTLLLATALSALLLFRLNRPPAAGWRIIPGTPISRLAPILFIFALLALSACSGGTTTGGGPHPGTTPGSYTLTVTATYTSGATTLSHQTNLTLVVQ